MLANIHPRPKTNIHRLQITVTDAGFQISATWPYVTADPVVMKHQHLGSSAHTSIVKPAVTPPILGRAGEENPSPHPSVTALLSRIRLPDSDLDGCCRGLVSSSSLRRRR